MTIDLGAPASDAVCTGCHLGPRPLWAFDGKTCCATCWARAYLATSITFRSGTLPQASRRLKTSTETR